MLTDPSMMSARASRIARALSLVALLNACGLGEAAEMALSGDTKQLRERRETAPPRSARHPSLLVLAIDGLNRDLLYDLLERGKLPRLARLLGGERGELPHAHLDRTTLSTLPSTTMAAWVTSFTGAPPAVHGVTGNELFVREERRFLAPVPVSFSDAGTMLKNYTDGYTNRAALVPSVFQRMRQRDPHVLIWAAMLPYHAGEDVLLKPDLALLPEIFARTRSRSELRATFHFGDLARPAPACLAGWRSRDGARQPPRDSSNWTPGRAGLAGLSSQLFAAFPIVIWSGQSLWQ